jgi:hypothetical protein
MANKLMYGGSTNPSNPISGSTEYEGLFGLRKGVLIFDSGSIPAKHISAVSNYPVRYKNRVSILTILICIVILTGLIALGDGTDGYSIYGFFIPLPILGFAIWERSRATRYGITLTIDSGDNFYFIHKAKAFINELYWAFVDALQKGHDFTANFSSTTIHGTNVINVESGASVGNISDNNSIQNTPTTMSNDNNGSNSITIGNGSSAGNISGNNSINGGTGSNSIAVGDGSDVGNISGNNQVTANPAARPGNANPKCRQCGYDNLPAAAFCGHCGNSLA